MTGTERFDSAQEYRQFVEMLARNNIDRDGSSAHFVANHAIVDTTEVEDGVATLYYSAEPYVDDPAEQIRLYPKDVLRIHSEDEWPVPLDPETEPTVRNVAVELLANEIESAMRDIQQETDQ